MFESHPENQLNLVQIFLKRASLYGQKTGLLYKKSGRYQSIAWSEWKSCVHEVAYGLHALGVKEGDRVGLLSENRPEWTYADLGILSLGAVVVPIYATSSNDDIAYVIQDSGSEVIFISAEISEEKMNWIIQKIPQIRRIISFGETRVKSQKIISLSDLQEMGRTESRRAVGFLQQRIDQVKPDDLATLIYTSGTTGPPKGVMLTHRNFIANYLGAGAVIKVNPSDIALSLLPLSHVFERLAGYYFMCFHGVTIAYAESMQTVPEDILLVRPTIAAAVPRFYEKIHAKIMERVEKAPSLMKKIFIWSLGVGQKVVEKKRHQETISWLLCLQYFIAKLLVFNKVKSGLGGKTRFFISGGAPLNKELGEFFYSAGLVIIEGYGLTETAPVIAANTVQGVRFGTVGRPLPNVEVKIAEDGEILTRSECVMRGYYHNESATQEVLREGWFHTGDIGSIDKEGFLRITDRKKDIIVTSSGKNIAPQNIEQRILRDSLFNQVIVIGDKRNYLVAIVVPNPGRMECYGKETGIRFKVWQELLQHEGVQGWVASRLRMQMEGLAPFERVKYFAMLPEELTQRSGELTPTLKIKRQVVGERYRDLVRELYEGGSRRIPCE
ncbi:MAG: long-chain fatty acid--CoA ligase [Candidatus Omnitrophica bacterium]|nr:long-chain fatty acid--CoA ligase [Candidatus Omnitrophota bacterium]